MDNFFDQHIKNHIKSNKNIRKVAIGKEDYTTACYLILISKEICQMIPIDTRKQQTLDADPKVIQQINFAANQERAGDTKFFLLLKKQEKLFQIFHKELVEYCKLRIKNLFWFNIV